MRPQATLNSLFLINQVIVKYMNDKGTLRLGYIYLRTDSPDIDLSYPFQSSTVTKKTFAKQLQKDLLKQLKVQQQIKRTNPKVEATLEKLKSHATTNSECMEILCFIILEAPSEDEVASQLKQTVFGLLLDFAQNFESELWKVHPWTLTELSQLSLPFFRVYISHLIKVLWRAVEKFCEQSITLEETCEVQSEFKMLQRRFNYLIQRSPLLKLACSEVFGSIKGNARLNSVQSLYNIIPE
jgi:DNA polymerase III alpha subunit (gram-positive type)